MVRNGILCAETEMLDYVAYEEEVGGNGGSAGLPPEEQDRTLHGDCDPAGVAPRVTSLDEGAAGTVANYFRFMPDLFSFLILALLTVVFVTLSVHFFHYFFI